MNSKRQSIEKEVMVIENLFMVPDKEGRDVPFILNAAQRKLALQLTGRDIVPKARQEGVSTLILALFTVRCLYKRNTRAVVISHDSEATKRLFKRVHYFIQNIRGPKPVVGVEAKNELSFPKTNSTFYIGTAGAKKFGRGDTITDLLCSEIAYWDNPKELFSGLSDSVPISGSIILESTGNGRNWYYDRVYAALRGDSIYTVHFLNWQDFPEYDLPVTEEEKAYIERTLDPDLEEDVLYKNGLLTAGQIKFRRMKLEDKDGDLQLFKQEYPMTLDECFQSTSHGFFKKVNFLASKEWKLHESTSVHKFWKLDPHPMPGHNYFIGVDVSGGTGQDYSSIEVFCVETFEQVGEWISNKIAPDRFGEIVANIGYHFNTAEVCVERNNHGLVTLDVLRKKYPVHKIYKDKKVGKSNTLLSYGIQTTVRSKPFMIGVLNKFLQNGLTIYSSILRDQLNNFIETITESGNRRLKGEKGKNDDCVMASALATYGYNKVARLLEESPVEQSGSTSTVDPFSLDAIVEELQSRNIVFPISPQVGAIQ